MLTYDSTKPEDLYLLDQKHNITREMFYRTIEILIKNCEYVPEEILLHYDKLKEEDLTIYYLDCKQKIAFLKDKIEYLKESNYLWIDDIRAKKIYFNFQNHPSVGRGMPVVHTPS